LAGIGERNDRLDKITVGEEGRGNGSCPGRCGIV
jgi:hypothetical protein